MSKSVLVIDTPENCYDCLFGTAYCGKLEYAGCCELAYRLNYDVILMTEEHYDRESKSRPDWCPLKPLPDKKEYIVPIDNVESQKDIIAVGWNAYANWAGNIYAIMSYIMTTERKRAEKQRPIQKVSSKKKYKNKSENKSIYLLSEIVDYVNDNGLLIKPSGNHKITCPCWSVRGHYRTYKSGKKVFVKSFEKGKERGKVAPKQHVYTI
nr:MAG TPA: hypothetical protein [Bacteriophage sp.]